MEAWSPQSMETRLIQRPVAEEPGKTPCPSSKKVLGSPDAVAECRKLVHNLGRSVDIPMLGIKFRCQLRRDDWPSFRDRAYTSPDMHSVTGHTHTQPRRPHMS